MIADPEKLAAITKRREILELMLRIAQSTAGSEEERTEALKELGRQSRDLKVKIDLWTHQ